MPDFTDYNWRRLAGEVILLAIDDLISLKSGNKVEVVSQKGLAELDGTPYPKLEYDEELKKLFAPVNLQIDSLKWREILDALGGKGWSDLAERLFLTKDVDLYLTNELSCFFKSDTFKIYSNMVYFRERGEDILNSPVENLRAKVDTRTKVERDRGRVSRKRKLIRPRHLRKV